MRERENSLASKLLDFHSKGVTVITTIHLIQNTEMRENLHSHR